GRRGPGPYRAGVSRQRRPGADGTVGGRGGPVAGRDRSHLAATEGAEGRRPRPLSAAGDGQPRAEEGRASAGHSAARAGAAGGLLARGPQGGRSLDRVENRPARRLALAAGDYRAKRRLAAPAGRDQEEAAEGARAPGPASAGR